jgi:glycosyltransferase involved in cell wall biosynthesis
MGGKGNDMQITIAEPAPPADPADFIPVIWPSGAGRNLRDLAGEMIAVAHSLARSVNGPLLGRTLLVAASRPEHILLARLLSCHGATVDFFCPDPVVWENHLTGLCRALESILACYHEHLDRSPLADFTTKRSIEGPYECILAHGLLTDTPEGAIRWLTRFSEMLRPGGVLEWFGSEEGPATRTIIEQALGHSSPVGLAVLASCFFPGGAWRLRFRRLHGREDNCPGEEDQLLLLREARMRLQDLERHLAHAQARRWEERNAFAATVDRLMQHGFLTEPGYQRQYVQAWFRGGHEAYASWEVLAGNWIDRFEELLACSEDRDTGAVIRQPYHWELINTKRGAVLSCGGLDAPPSVRTVLYPRPEGEVGIRSLWRWWRRGAETVWFHRSNGWKQYDLAGYLAWRIVHWVGRRAFRRLSWWRVPDIPRGGAAVMRSAMRLGRRSRPAELFHPVSGVTTRADWQAWVANGNSTIFAGSQFSARALKTVHYIGALSAGGAERQLCNLVQSQKRRGIDVRVLTMCALERDHAHYTALLTEEKVPLRQAGRPYVSPVLHATAPWALLRAVPDSIQAGVMNLVYELLANRPDVLHCWLDQPNVVGAIAGLMAGVPLIVLSTRNSNPTNFPRLLEDYLLYWYQMAALSSRVYFIANSHSGAASYAEWIGVPEERFHVVFNGVCLDHFPRSTTELRRQSREAFGLAPEDLVVCGLFRLAAEKQPELFLDVVRRVHARVPRLKVLLAGVGDLEERVHQIVRETGMDGYVQLLGRRTDVATVFMASDASLLTSTLEGCPNVALESQYLGVPIVATAGGGTVDAVEHGVTGFFAGVSDAAGLAGHLTRILLDPAMRQRLSAAGPPFVQERFGLEQMLDQTLAVYESARSPASTRPHIVPPEAKRKVLVA